MINIKVGTNTKRNNDIVSEDMTPRALLEKWKVEYRGGQTNLNSYILQDADLDKPLSAFSDKLKMNSTNFISVVSKQDNAR